MLGARTVLILGAGASQPFGFPLGSTLVANVAAAVAERPLPDGSVAAFEPDFHRLMEMKYGRTNLRPFYDAGIRLAESIWGYRSIDDFLSAHAADETMVRVAKTAVVHVIAKAEQRSALGQVLAGDDSGWTKLEGSWLHLLFQTLAAGVPANNPSAIFNRLSIVTFNYDRSLETFFACALMRVFKLSREKATQLVGEYLNIFRPYGGLGRIWNAPASPAVPFGPEGELLHDLAPGIAAYTEGVAPSERMREAVFDSRRIVFLGFGFHRQNMQLFKRVQAFSKSVTIHATTYTEPEPRRAAFASMIAETMRARASSLHQGDCAHYLAQWWTELEAPMSE